MAILNKKEPFLLVAGDLFLLILSLWLMLFLRYGGIPEQGIFSQHLVPFSFLFVVWIAVFYIAGLYEKHTVIFRSKLPSILVKAELVNSLIAVLFFYFIPDFGISPKFNLFIYLAISFLLILFWRIYSYPILGTVKKQSAILIGTGVEMNELEREINGNPRYSIRFIESADVKNLGQTEKVKELFDKITAEKVAIIVADFSRPELEPILSDLYRLLFSRTYFVDMHRMYEEIFDRIPLSLVKYRWFLQNISISRSVTYDILKRFMDIICAFLFGLVSLIFYPFIIGLIKLDDGGSVFIFQERIGQFNELFKAIKFRTMAIDDGGVARFQKGNKPTRVGPFLRRTRLDELPQFWNVLVGDLSLIGPRPELPNLVMVYERELPYYNVRHLIKPGLFGWAQLYHDNHPHHAVDVDETRVKVSYDLYYIKNRSLFLDLKIAIKTLKVLLSRSGR